jgi:hypothetical protein
MSLRGNNNKNTDHLRKISIGAAMLVYVAMVGYSTYHNIMLMTRGVKGDGVIFAYVGIVALEITALFLPLAVKFWALSPGHSFAAYSFYVVNLALVITNSILNFNLQSNQPLPSYMTDYLHVVVPATPFVCGIGWALLLTLDPFSQVLAKKKQLDQDTALAYLNAQAEYVEKDANYLSAIESKARRDQWEVAVRTYGIKEVKPEALPSPDHDTSVSGNKNGGTPRANFIKGSWFSLNSEKQPSPTHTQNGYSARGENPGAEE